MSGPDGAALFMLILLIGVILFYVVVPLLYDHWKKAHRHKHA